MTAGDSLPASIDRGVALLAGVGAVLGAAVGTCFFPVLGTVVGACVLGTLGAIAGLADGMLLWVVRRRTRSPWAARAASGVLSLAVTVRTGWPLAASGFPRVAVVVPGVLAVVCGTVLGPLIAAGESPRPATGSRSDCWDPPDGSPDMA